MSKQAILIQGEANSGGIRHDMSAVGFDFILTFVEMSKINHEIFIDESSASYQYYNYNDGLYNYNDTEFFEELTIRNGNI
jgi:hypothetical protein